MRRLPLLLLLPAFGASAASAQAPPAPEPPPPAVAMAAPEYGGSGCPQGTAAAALGVNAQKVAMLFDAYVLEAGGSNPRPFARGSCNLAIPVTVPDGMSVAVFAIDFLGFNLLPAGAESVFRAEYFFAGDQGTPLETTFTGPLNADFVVQQPIAEDALVWSACGEDVILRANTSVQLRGIADQPAMTTIEAAVGYRLRTRTC